MRAVQVFFWPFFGGNTYLIFDSERILLQSHPGYVVSPTVWAPQSRPATIWDRCCPKKTDKVTTGSHLPSEKASGGLGMTRTGQIWTIQGVPARHTYPGDHMDSWDGWWWHVLVIRYRPAGRGRSRGQGQAAAGGGSAGVLRVTLVTTTSTRGVG